MNQTVKQKRSKAIDMRYYWLRDRVAQKQFRVHWQPGTDNRADYFTKHHSPAHHIEMRGTYLYAVTARQIIEKTESHDPVHQLLQPSGAAQNTSCHSEGVLKSPGTAHPTDFVLSSQT